MKLSDFDFHLPEDLIATRPASPRSSARLLVAQGDAITDSHVFNLPDFLRPGDPSIPIIYEVDRSRDGGSFTTRRVVAIQHGKQILNMSASFHITEEGWHHQHPMPAAPAPDSSTWRRV